MISEKIFVLMEGFGCVGMKNLFSKTKISGAFVSSELGANNVVWFVRNNYDGVF